MKLVKLPIVRIHVSRALINVNMLRDPLLINVLNFKGNVVASALRLKTQKNVKRPAKQENINVTKSNFHKIFNMVGFRRLL